MTANIAENNAVISEGAKCRDDEAAVNAAGVCDEARTKVSDMVCRDSGKFILGVEGASGPADPPIAEEAAPVGWETATVGWEAATAG